jgi:hypothetical protein
MVDLSKREVDLLLDILDSMRIDAILEENDLCQDELGIIMAKLGREDMRCIYEKV